MNRKTDKKGNAVSVLFTMLLFLVFVLCALFTVLIGSRVYENINVRSDANYTYWGFSPANSRWEIITKKSGKAKIKVIKNGKTIKEFKVIVKKPRIRAKMTKNSVNLKLKNVGNRYGVTLHNVKWVFTPVNTEQDSNTAPEIPKTPSNSDTTKNDPSTSTEVPDNSNTITTPDTTIVEGSTAITLAQSVATTAPSPITNRQRSAKVTIIKPGTYRVQATLLGKTYTLNKTVTVPEIDYSTRW